MFLRLHEDKEEDEINWDKCPPDIEDFPDDVQKAIMCYHKLPDRIVPDVGFIGKDYSMFDLLVRIEFVTDESLFLETLLQLDTFYRKKNQKDLEVARKKSGVGKR